MGDLLEDLIQKRFPNRTSIFRLVDDYTLFCYYLEQEVGINQPILSPIRETKEDTLPSFVIFPDKTTGELKFFDHGNGEAGTVFDLIQRLYGYKTFEEICARISEDFGLGITEEGLVVVDPAKQPFLKHDRPPQVGLKDVINHESFSAEGKQYWKDYYITPEILKEYNVNQVRSIILDNNIVIAVKGLAFSYRIGTKHKIYQPFDPEMKFRNNFPREYVEGYYQLVQRPPSPVLFITKSMKDVMAYRVLNLDAVAPKAENQVIPDFILKKLQERYKYIFTVFDDDPAGRKGVTRYPFSSLWIPVEGTCKDTADYLKKHGPVKTKELLKQLIMT